MMTSMLPSASLSGVTSLSSFFLSVSLLSYHVHVCMSKSGSGCVCVSVCVCLWRVSVLSVCVCGVCVCVCVCVWGAHPASLHLCGEHDHHRGSLLPAHL